MTFHSGVHCAKVAPASGRGRIEGDEIVHALLHVMAAGASYTVIRCAMHIHPTVSELLTTLLANLQDHRTH